MVYENPSGLPCQPRYNRRLVFPGPSCSILNVPIYDAAQQANIPIQSYADGGSEALQMIAFGKTVRTIAIGSIVGGGMFGLAKMWRTFANIFTDIGAAFTGERQSGVHGRKRLVRVAL